MSRTRTTVTVLLLCALALVGAGAAYVTFGFAQTYADPTASSMEHLRSFAGSIAFPAAVLIGLGAGAVVVSRGRRGRVGALSLALVVASVAGIVAANRYGLEAKQKASSVPPLCGLGEGELNATWQSLDHAGYFEGGETSAAHCSYRLTATDLSATVASYEKQLQQRGWTIVSSTPQRIEASGEGYRFEAEVPAESPGSPAALSVTLRAMKG